MTVNNTFGATNKITLPHLGALHHVAVVVVLARWLSGAYGGTSETDQRLHSRK